MKKFNDFLMKDETFVLLIAGAAAAIFAGTYMFINFNVGAFNEVSVTAMLSDRESFEQFISKYDAEKQQSIAEIIYGAYEYFAISNNINM